MIASLIERCHATIAGHAEVLTELDRAIGDGDHGINLERGFDVLLAEKDAIAELPWPKALQEAGKVLVSKVGGASGALYGSFLLGMAKAAEEGVDVASQVEAGVAAVRKRGKSDVGAKTMLDVLVPVSEALAEGRAGDLRRIADEAREATGPMKATRGRASFLGERSIGHCDPGATSARLLIHAVLDVIEQGDAR
ncbi:MAG: dihydroxyacetone kinase subunit L [Geminicoccaceae bacterium]|nr:dihydroxyacetone kinase subunit L [Geminicoccaceae bacterium]